MDPDELEELIATYEEHISPEIDGRLLRSLCREIERTTNQKAMASVYAAAASIQGREDTRRLLEVGRHAQKKMEARE